MSEFQQGMIVGASFMCLLSAVIVDWHRKWFGRILNDQDKICGQLFTENEKLKEIERG